MQPPSPRNKNVQRSVEQVHCDVTTLPRPICLDLFCGGGGAARGLIQAGFATVVGVDNADHRKSYERVDGATFMRCGIDAITPPFVKQFDFVWASPPCQAHSSMVFKSQKVKFISKWQSEGRHIDYIPQTRSLLVESGVPFVIENVAGARKSLQGPLLKLCGTMFDLRVFRHRLFEIGNGMPEMEQPMCNHTSCGLGVLGESGRRAPRTEHLSDVAVMLRNNGGVPPGFRREEKRYPSHQGQVDYLYYGEDAAMTGRIKEMYNRNYCRSVKEALRLTGDLTPLTEEEREAERTRWEQGAKDGLSRSTPPLIQMYPIYGLKLSRGLTAEWRSAMGIEADHMTRGEIRESIPPAYSEYIGKVALRHITT